MAKLTTFSDTEAASSGPFAGSFLWSDTNNWSNGIPANGDSVTVDGTGFDDLAPLALADLNLTASSDLDVVGSSLNVATVTSVLGTALFADASDAGAQVTLTIGTISTSGGSFGALGTGGIFIDNSATDAGNSYQALLGGLVELAAPPSGGSEIDYTNHAAAFALENPAASNPVAVQNLTAGDTLELPGTSVSNVSFGASSLSVTTSAGTYAFTNVSYLGTPVGGFTAAHDSATGLEAITFLVPDVFNDTEAASSGPFVGSYLWSDANNWSDGLPVAGDDVTVDAPAMDDLASLNISGLDVTAGIMNVVGSSLNVTTLTASGGTSLLADASDAGAPVTVTIGTIGTSGGNYGALGAGGIFTDNSATDTGNNYETLLGGLVELAAPPSGGSEMAYNNGAATFALENPAASNGVAIQELTTGDILELPGTSVSTVSFGASSLSVTTNAGTYAFTDVGYFGTPVSGFTAAHDSTTGLEAVTFNNADTFQETTAATGGVLSGQYLWSNINNWTAGLPTDGGSVSTAFQGYDDVPSLSLASLDLATGGQVQVVGSALTVAALTVAQDVALAAGSPIAGATSGPVTVTVNAISGTGGQLGATGADSVFVDNAASDPGESYFEADGGTTELAARPNNASSLQYLGGTPGTLALEDPAASNGVAIQGLAAGDVLELPGTSVTTVGFGANSLSVTTSAGSYDFTDVSYAGTPTGYTASHDSATGLEAVEIACFAAGTRIRTERGAVAVEALRVGDRVPVAMGDKLQPIVWLGETRVDCRRHPRPTEVWPVRVSAGAFGLRRPVRDLLLSPDHAVYVDGVLIPIRYLVNGTTIRQEACDEAAYWHVELAEHNVLYAEGVPVESYLDTGNRHAFAIAGPVVMAQADFALGNSAFNGGKR